VGPERLAQPARERWVRVELNAACGLRRGAWYPVLSVGKEEIVVEARHKLVVVPRSCVGEIVTTRLNTWTMVPRASGGPYAVCPNCADRVIVNRSSEKMLCGGCHGWFELEPDPAAVNPD
jgi:hypothetical protein